ncbi:HEPN domain-containing protein [Candidatus Woesearchaeota archaeon]|nr:HEPN domain-containing protein [Candidatus Woesearchaeota archaeon]
MNTEIHLEKARRIEASIAKLDEEDDLEVIAESAYGAAQHYIACICQKKIGSHMETHKGLIRFLRENGLVELSNIFKNIEELRIGRWYGKKANGETANLAKELLGRIREVAENGGKGIN